nr:hypothetical protein [Deltaproteobacteria bacterium]
MDRRKHGAVVGLASPEKLTVSYVVRDARNNELLKGTAVVSAVGGFDARFTLPKTPNLGFTRVELSIAGESSYTHLQRVEEFRTPEFEVSAQASQGPFLVGAGGDVTVNAKYYAGGALAGAPVTWSVSATPTSFTPPNRDDYVFGNWQPWWGGGGRGDYEDYEYDEGPRYRSGRGGKRAERTSWNFAGKTDAIGVHTLHLDFLSMKPAMPMSVQTTASVTDVNRQARSASSALVVHPAAFYVGLRSVRPFVEQGTPFDLDVIGVDLDGRPAIGAKVAVSVSRLEYSYDDGEYKTKEVDPQTCPVTVAKDAHPCHFATKQGGTYQVVATILDPQGRSNQTTLTFWVSGGERPPAREVAQEEVQIIPDKKEYSPGNTAELLVQAPFYPAEGIVTWRRSGIVKTERITFTGPSKVITVPIEDAMTPNLIVQVDVVGMATRADDKGLPDPKLPKRPA